MRVSGLGLLLFCACTAGQTVTWSGQVAGIVFSHCAPCHRPGEIAPFPLLTYADVSKRASQIVAVTRRRFMPPWPPEPGFGDFAGSRRLSDEQLNLIEQWAREGAPLGDASQAPAPPHFTPGWQLGPPDAILRMPAPFRLPAEAGDVFRNFVVPVDFKQTRYIRAIELRLDNPRVVHHANVLVDRARSLRSRDGKDGQPGFPGMDVETESGETFDPDSHFLFWKPGTVPQVEPADMAWRLDPSDDLVVNLHLQPTGKPESVQASIGLYFAAQAPTRFPILVQLEHDGAIDIPPGARGFAITDHFVLPVACDVLAVYPHAHYLGKQIDAWAELPNGSRQALIRINDWDINWQASYTYRKPVPLPAGTKLAMRITYDNSADNPRNPHSPPRRVKTGNRSDDEMGHVWFQLLPHGNDARMELHQAVMRRRLEKYPADYVAHYNLGAALLAAGREKEALEYLDEAAHLRPDAEAARNAYGVALLASGRLEEAGAEFSAVLKQDPDYANARVNLAQVLASQGDTAGAIRELDTYLARRPNDGKAHYLLAGIYTGENKIPEALPHLERAAELEPDNSEVQTNLGTALAITGDLRGAMAAFEQALRIDPGNATAKQNLERARNQLGK
ncbi:MAG TPA: tetratricopeptide repeat protein, partial [Bryobacteraceae bacterium]|nr:tetratricopeptide repeat protein [Bryobacteraceae bacterium]